MIPAQVANYLEAQGLGRVTNSEAVSGGCISNGQVIRTSTGAQMFLKTHGSAPPAMFECEANGLAALAAANGGPRVPRVYVAGTDFILLEYLAPAPPRADFWPMLGERLARLHTTTHDHFGFDHDNYIGLTPQPNSWEADGHVFFAEHRLRQMGLRCLERRLLEPRAWRRLERLADRLLALIPAQPASLLHGDLWSGNIIPGPDGEACLIDPAAHYGWAEADLAMTTLFGQPPQRFFEAYEAVRPPAAGYRERFDVYNLYHLLNHLGLFGGGYAEAVEAVLRRFG